ncbi:MAG: L,D-transpeptidase family protein [Alphaproteobacteria bacterium]|nr:L,D-transpeptidase family protein [Alphaproteobacteria bacterium]
MKRNPVIVFFIALLLSGPAFAKYDKSYVGDMITYKAQEEDTFVHIARDFNLGFVEMRAANPDIDPWIPGKGTKVTLPTRHILPDAPREGVVINLPEMRMYVFRDGDQPILSFPIGVGRDGLETPVGHTKILRKMADPVWRPTDRMRREKPELPATVEAGPENPMGTHALYLGWPTYAIHGTNRAFGIGRRVSSGCIRLYPEDIISLYNLVPVGTDVTVVDQPLKLGWIDDKLYMEVHPTIRNAVQMEETGQIPEEGLTEKDVEMIRKMAGSYEDRLHWPAIRKAAKERRGYPIEIMRRPQYEAQKEGAADSQLSDIDGEESQEAEAEQAPPAITKSTNAGPAYPPAEKPIVQAMSDDSPASPADLDARYETLNR